MKSILEAENRHSLHVSYTVDKSETRDRTYSNFTILFLTCKRGSVGKSDGLLIPGAQQAEGL